MITSIPSSSEFRNAGIEILNLAWDNVHNHFEYLVNLDDDEHEARDEYWQSAQQSISTALSLAQQGIEFLLKGKICDVDPLLLIATPTRDWPGEKDIPFADLRTVESQDLIRCHDSIISPSISPRFATIFNELRRKRNTIMHSVSKQLRISGNDVLVAILEAADTLIGSHSWPSQRRNYLENGNGVASIGIADLTSTLYHELDSVIDILPRKDVIRFLNFDKRNRRYACPECTGYAASVYDEAIDLAQLRPNEPTSTSIYCVICGQTYSVKRESCGKKGCKGNVVYEEGKEKLCLTCNL